MAEVVLFHHALGLTPKGRLFALTRDELLEAMALVRAIRAGRLDAIVIPVAPLDILAQQIVAEVACGDWSNWNACGRASPHAASATASRFEASSPRTRRCACYRPRT